MSMDPLTAASFRTSRSHYMSSPPSPSPSSPATSLSPRRKHLSERQHHVDDAIVSMQGGKIDTTQEGKSPTRSTTSTFSSPSPSAATRLHSTSTTFPSTRRVTERIALRQDAASADDLSDRQWITEAKKREWRSSGKDVEGERPETGDSSALLDLSRRLRQVSLPLPASPPPIELLPSTPAMDPVLAAAAVTGYPAPLQGESLSSSPSRRSPSTSILDRPRPQISDAYSRSWTTSSSSVSPSSSRRYASSSTSNSILGSSDSVPERVAATILHAPSSRSGSPSLLDRPRPRTPDPTSTLSSKYTSSRRSSRPSTRSLGQPSLSSPAPFISPAAVEMTKIAKEVSSFHATQSNMIAAEEDSTARDTIFDISSYFREESDEEGTALLKDAILISEDRSTRTRRQTSSLVLHMPPLGSKKATGRVGTREQGEGEEEDDFDLADQIVDYYDGGGLTPFASVFLDLQDQPVVLSSATLLSTQSSSGRYETPRRTTSLSSSSSSSIVSPRDDMHSSLVNSQTSSSSTLSSPSNEQRRSSSSTPSIESTSDSSRSRTSIFSDTSTKENIFMAQKGTPYGLSLHSSAALSIPDSLFDAASDKSLPPTPSPVRSSSACSTSSTITPNIPGSPAESLQELDVRSSQEASRTNFGRRMIDRFNSSSKHSSPASSSPDIVHGNPTTPTRGAKLFIRKDSSASTGFLMSGGLDESEKKGKIRLTAEAILGIGGTSARRSEDTLSNARNVGRKSSDQSSPGLMGRKSLDLFSSMRKSDKTTRSSPDNLFSVAANKLSQLATKSSSKSSPSETFCLSPSSNLSPTDSATSLHSIDQSPEKASITTATRITRSTPLDPPSPLQGPSKGFSMHPILAESHEKAVEGVYSAVQVRSDGSDRRVDDASSISSDWNDLADALIQYSSMNAPEQLADRGPLLVTFVLPFIRSEDKASITAVNEGSVAQRKRSILFEWLSTLTDELKDTQPSHRGACLESVAAIAESHHFSITSLSGHNAAGDCARYRRAVVRLLSFAIDKLNDKAVYANTLVLAGRILALAFFRIEGVALKLLRALPNIKRSFLRRILAEVGVDEHHLPSFDHSAFPEHLSSLFLTDFASYTALLTPIDRRASSSDRFLVQDGDIDVEMSGNWLIRWTASDSDLPFAFYRGYGRQLAAYLAPNCQSCPSRPSTGPRPLLSPSSIVCTPAFLFLSASLLEKLDALIHRNLRSVTSMGPGDDHFNSNDSANLEIGRKPKILELANRRIVSTLADLVGGPPAPYSSVTGSPPDGMVMDRRCSFSSMLQVWIRATVKRTSMYDTRSIFILLDLLEGLIYTLSYPAVGEKMTIAAPDEACLAMFDLPFIFSFLRTILLEADNTVAVTRTIAFIYAHFELFTLRPEDRRQLCETILLDELIFQRHYLSWNGSIRSYFIRLLVWRVARLGLDGQKKDPDIIAIFSLLNLRLEAIRRRHDELEPEDATTILPSDDLYRPKRSTICSTRAELEAPYVVAEIVHQVHDVEDGSELGSAFEVVSNGRAKRSGSEGGRMIMEGAAVSTRRVVSWIKGGIERARASSISSIRSRGASSGLGNVRIDPFRIDDEELALPPSLFLVDPEEASLQEHHIDSIILPSPPLIDGEVAALQYQSDSGSRSLSPAFFSFEFEGASSLPVSPPSSSFLSTVSDSADIAQPCPPSALSMALLNKANNRASHRFSKRQSILPPAALMSLGKLRLVVPELSTLGYDKSLHCYAIRGLRDYEDALDEWSEWLTRLQAEQVESDPRLSSFIDEVPRLSVPWQACFVE